MHDERYTIIYLGIAIIVRLLAHYVQESVANRLGSAVKATFRKRALAHMFKLGVQHKERHGDVIHMLTDGLEQVDAYVARYIPQIFICYYDSSYYGHCYCRYIAYNWHHSNCYSTIDSILYDLNRQASRSPQ